MGSVPQLQFDVPEDPFGRRIDEGFGHSPQSVVEDRTEVLHGGPDPGFAVGLGGGGERNGVHVRPRRGETSRRKIAPVIVLLFSTYFYQSHPPRGVPFDFGGGSEYPDSACSFDPEYRMPTFTIEYTTEAERIILERAVAFVTQMRRVAVDAPAGTVVDACERVASTRGRTLLNDVLGAAIRGRADLVDAKKKSPATDPKASENATS